MALYQNSTGTIPVTGDNQPVGLVIDKSQGGTVGSSLDVTTWTNHSWDTFSGIGVGFTASKDSAGGTALSYSNQKLPCLQDNNRCRINRFV